MHYSKARHELPLSWARWSNRAMRLQCLSMLARISHGWGLRMAALFAIKRVEGAFNEPHKGAPYRDRVYPSPLAVCTRTALLHNRNLGPVANLLLESER